MAGQELLVNFGIALGLGALIGLEREYTQMQRGGSRGWGGVRTFPLIALLGALIGFFSEKYSVSLAAIGFSAVAALIIISHYVFASKRERIGITSEVAGMVTFFVGTLSYLGMFVLAVAVTVIMTLLLYHRFELHRFAERMKAEELYSTIKFALIAFVILPILPDKAYGPFELFNPYKVWLLVVLVSAISFIGYILVKWIGTRGSQLAAFLGGFVSSTATTLSILSEKEKARGYSSALFRVLVSNAAMIIKILVLVFIVKRAVFIGLLGPLGLMLLGTLVAGFFLYEKAPSSKLELRSPFTLKPALEFAGMFSVVLFLVKLATFYYGHNGIYAITFISGLVDADSTVLSTLQLTTDNFVATAATAAVLAVVANTITKVGWAFAFGQRGFALRLGGLLGGIGLMGVLWLVLF